MLGAQVTVHPASRRVSSRTSALPLQHAAEKGVAPDTHGRNTTQKEVAPGSDVDLDTPPFGEPPKLFYTGVESGLAGGTDASIQIRRFQLVELAHLWCVVKHTRCETYTNTRTHCA